MSELSPRTMVGLKDQPGEGDKVITPKEAKALQEVASKPVTSKEKKLPAKVEKVKMMVANKLSGALEEAGFTAGVAAKIIMDAAEATKLVSVTLEDEGDTSGKVRRTLEEVPDHGIRLAAYKMAEESLRRAEVADKSPGEGADYSQFTLEEVHVFRKLKAKQQAINQKPLEVELISVNSETN